jgi:hypothetical protein
VRERTGREQIMSRRRLPIIVGAPSEDGGAGDPVSSAGAEYVFGRDEVGIENCGEVEKLVASDPQSHDEFGVSVAITGAIAIVGAWSEDGGPGDPINNAGAAYLFHVGLFEAFRAD